MKRFLRILSLAILLTLIIAIPVFAIANPTSITIHSAGPNFSGVSVYEKIFETGDRLFVINYNVSYALPVPTQPASTTYLANLLAADGTTLIKSRVLNDYQHNLISIYFTAAQATSANLTWGSNYILRITGNPALFTNIALSSNMTQQTLAPGDWKAEPLLSIFPSSKSYLQEDCISIAKQLETDLGHTYTGITNDGRTVLVPLGRTLFLAAIPGLDTAIPDLFQFASGTIPIPTVTSNASLEKSTNITAMLGAPTAAAFAGIGTWLHISEAMSGGLWALLFILTIISIAFLNSGNTTGSIIVALPIVILLTYLGAIPVALTFTITLLICAYAGYFIILRGL